MKAAQPASHLSDDALRRLLEARHHDPFTVLGRHDDAAGATIRAFLPHAREARIADLDAPMRRIEGTDLFEWQGDADALPARYRLRWQDTQGLWHERHDPYAFPAQLGDFDLHLFGEGRHWHIYRVLGSHPCVIDAVAGVRFAVWAPNAERVSVVGDFNRWDGRIHPMRSRGGSGVWELFIPDIDAGQHYKYEIYNRQGQLLTKADPYGQYFERRPGTASRIPPESGFTWEIGRAHV